VLGQLVAAAAAVCAKQAEVWLEILQAVTPQHVIVQLAGDLLRNAAASNSNESTVLVDLLTSRLPVGVLQQVQLPDVCSLMRAAVQCAAAGSGLKVAALATLPAALKMGPHTLDSLLTYVGQLRTADAAAGIDALCDLPAAQQLSAGSLAGMLAAAAAVPGRWVARMQGLLVQCAGVPEAVLVIVAKAAVTVEGQAVELGLMAGG
jgi:hypothetical protein